MNKNYNDAIGAWLMKERLKQGLSLQDVADRLGVTKSAVYYWETGKRTIYADNMLNYCNVLGVDPADLIQDVTGVPYERKIYN